MKGQAESCRLSRQLRHLTQAGDQGLSGARVANGQLRTISLGQALVMLGQWAAFHRQADAASSQCGRLSATSAELVRRWLHSSEHAGVPHSCLTSGSCCDVLSAHVDASCHRAVCTCQSLQVKASCHCAVCTCQSMQVESDAQENCPEVACTAHHAGLILCLSLQVVDLDALKELCWSGVPADLRPLCWRLLSGYLPPNRDRRCTTGAALAG